MARQPGCGSHQRQAEFGSVLVTVTIDCGNCETVKRLQSECSNERQSSTEHSDSLNIPDSVLLKGGTKREVLANGL
jgi:hypothetical protein